MWAKSTNLLKIFNNTKKLVALSAIAILFLCIYSHKIWAQMDSLFNAASEQFAGISNLMSATANNDVDGVRFFSKAGALVINQRNKGGATALHIASRESNYEIAKILIENGANVNIQDNEGWTPLMRASNAGNPELVNYLLTKGAKANILNSQNESALIHATLSRCTDCINHIIQNGNLVKELNTLILKNQVADAFIIARNQENKQNQSILESFLDYISKMSPLMASQADSLGQELPLIPSHSNIDKYKNNKNFAFKSLDNKDSSNLNQNSYTYLEDPNLPPVSSLKNTDLPDISKAPEVSLNDPRIPSRYRLKNAQNIAQQPKYFSQENLSQNFDQNISLPVNNSLNHNKKKYKFKSLDNRNQPSNSVSQNQTSNIPPKNLTQTLQNQSSAPKINQQNQFKPVPAKTYLLKPPITQNQSINPNNLNPKTSSNKNIDSSQQALSNQDIVSPSKPIRAKVFKLKSPSTPSQISKVGDKRNAPNPPILNIANDKQNNISNNKSPAVISLGFDNSNSADNDQNNQNKKALLDDHKNNEIQAQNPHINSADSHQNNVHNNSDRLQSSTFNHEHHAIKSDDNSININEPKPLSPNPPAKKYKFVGTQNL